MRDKKLLKVISTKITAEDYDFCREVARQLYIDKTIQAPSVSELVRLVLYRELKKYRSKGNISSGGFHPRQLYLNPLMKNATRPRKMR